ncbi:MAG: DUF411 domain-containing protein [Spongiibacter sp.]|uniref:DUF411 domain-containing protein n=1 Tax=Spongiibacter thalassae TaxID=2721624 RepID=A0ABX1GAY7_9GAMM|nr:DUF411 domain-containing protein [Spongiibacter thalassae]MDX1504147.1 DUF411 domain-containing protein [Spongiibacter sp.]NKI16315.1 DUF411 domain-containing protein [Spongiibacter thalassae]
MKSQLFSLLLLGSFSLPLLAQNADPFTVYKNPQCGCCSKWIDHLRDDGFSASGENRDDMPTLKAELKVPANLQSCHTGVQGNFVFEGHIPSAVVRRFLDNPPEGAYGLAVPGMPIGSPGMEMGPRRDRYDVIVLMHDGNHQVYTTIN